MSATSTDSFGMCLKIQDFRSTPRSVDTVLVGNERYACQYPISRNCGE